MSIIRWIALAIIVVGMPSHLWAAQTLYEQPPVVITGSNLIGASSTRPTDVANEYTSRTFDNFSLGRPSQITTFSWVGAFSGVFNPAPDPQFRSDADFAIEIFGNSLLGGPDLSDSRFSVTLEGGKAGIDDSTEVSSSILPGVQQREGGVVIRYTADVAPLVLDAGTYWLSIQSSQNYPSGTDFVDPDWLWVRGTGGDGGFYNYDEQFGDQSEPGTFFNSGCPDPCDAAFSLIGNPLAPVGDYDGSGVVEQRDLDLVLLNWGRPVNPVPSGWVNDLPTGVIDQSELDNVLLYWGSGRVELGAATVPEPSCLVLVPSIFGVLCLSSRRRRALDVVR